MKKVKKKKAKEKKAKGKKDDEKKDNEKKDNKKKVNIAIVYKTSLKAFELKFYILEEVEEGTKLIVI